MNAPVRASGGGRKRKQKPSHKSSITRIAPPEQLRDDLAIGLWKKQSKVLIDRGMFEPEDSPVLMAYCNAFSLMLSAEQIISNEGMTIKTADGGQKKHPAVAVRNDCISQLARLGSLLGLDPLSRTRFMGGGQKPGEPQGNDFDEF